jgi:peptidoglycan/LPS O-acetylase OafA/YrhL
LRATSTFSKTPFAAGGAFVFLGFLMRLKDMREGLKEGLEGVHRRLASQKTIALMTIVLTAIVWLPSHLLPLGRWAAQNAAQYQDEARYTRLGILIRETTPPDFRIAVAAAGATPYFAQRPTEDLLGKNDKHVAKTPPRGVFSPGHDKWDYEWSLGDHEGKIQNPTSLIVETVDVNEADEAYMASLGFAELPNMMRLRASANVERRDVLGREMTDGNALLGALTELGVTLPSGLRGVDIGMILAFALLVFATARAIVKDVEPWSVLSPEAPAPSEELDAAQQAAVAGSNTKAIPTLDGMRGIAVLLVLMFHFAWTFPGDDPHKAFDIVEKVAVRVHAFMWSGWTGVDLFFVLSGYLITRGLVAPSKKTTGTRLKMFWMRRVLRIFPLYYAVLIVGTIITLAFGAKWVPTAAYWLYMQNYALAFDDEVMRWVAHFWSLAIEEQFYFVWPLVAVLVTRRKIIPTILVLTVFTVGLRAFLTFKGHQIGAFQGVFDNPLGVAHGVAKFVYRATFTRADGLLLGAFVAVTQREIHHPISHVWRRLRFPLWVATAIALLGLYIWANGLNDYDRRIIGIGYVTLALFFACSVSLCADHVISERMRRFLSWKPLVSCGKVSYGMYIFHWPLVVLMVPYLEKMNRGMSVGGQMALGIAAIVVGIAIIYVLASISFRFFESPFLKMKHKFHD